MSDADTRWMDLALSLGRRGQGQVWPNPAVGCVIVQGSRVVGRGWTAPGGRPHAETTALEMAGPQARGATAYVTLEPCAHHGKTPPCAEALIAAGVARVVVALGDPDPRVSGKGLEMLRAAGIIVETGVREAQARADHEGFLSRVARNRPMVTLKLAQSLDGRIATASGESQWITGSSARRAVHAMRARHDAVMIGAGTARADLPSLTVRDMGVVRQPVRVVLSRALDLPQEGPLWEDAKSAPLWMMTTAAAPAALQEAWSSRGAETHLIDGDRLGAGVVLERLAGLGITRVFCEGGGQLAASLLGAGLVDRLVTFTAGIALGADGLPGLGALGLDSLAAAPRFDRLQTQLVGADVMTVWRRTDLSGAAFAAFG